MATPTPALHFARYPDTEGVPNVVVDGAPNDSTVLTLTHWPGYPQPAGLSADLSAQMAFRYLDRQDEHGPATVVTNNHFDQDGLVSVLALTDPETALRDQALLTDVAAAGDFATYRDRRAARASMALSAYAHPDVSPIADRLRGRPYPDQCGTLYEETLPLLLPMVTEPDRFRDLWADEDENLTASEKAIVDGDITIHEHPDIDLAVVTIADHLPRRGGHRFAGGDVSGEVHPMAIHNATGCVRLLVIHGRHYRFVDRYETWVQYRSRRLLPRVDLRPLADRLTEIETGRTTWSARAPSGLTPTMAPDTESSLPPDDVLQALTEHLRQSPPAWNPYSTSPTI